MCYGHLFCWILVVAAAAAVVILIKVSVIVPVKEILSHILYGVNLTEGHIKRLSSLHFIQVTSGGKGINNLQKKNLAFEVDRKYEECNSLFARICMPTVW